MAREFNIKTVTGTESITDLHITVTTTFQDLLSDFTYAELLESESLYTLLSDSNIIAQDENGTSVSGFGSVNPPASGTQIMALHFGAKSDSLGKFLIAGGTADKADDSSKTKTRATIPFDGTIISAGYLTKEADTTTQMKLHINGVVEETFLLTNVNANFAGAETLNTSVSLGDYGEIEYDSGQKCGECTFYLLVEKS